MSDLKTESKLEKLLTRGEFVVTAEISPPKHASAAGIRQQAYMLKDCVDAANITDCQIAIVRLSSIAAAVHVLNCGLEPVVQMTCRDRNRLAIQSDLLGAYSLGARNLLCLSGDHQKFGNHPTSKNVYDLDSVQLVYLMRRMRDEKVFFSGEQIKEHAPRFYIGAVANPFADPLALQVMRLEKKIEAGAEFIQTQGVYDLQRFEQFMEIIRERDLHQRAHILAGILPLKSWRTARYLQTGVPGMLVSDEIVERLKKAGAPEEEGITIASEQIRYLRKHVPGLSGVHIMTIAWAEAVPEIVKRSGLYPRPKA